MSRRKTLLNQNLQLVNERPAETSSDEIFDDLELGVIESEFFNIIGDLGFSLPYCLKEPYSLPNQIPQLPDFVNEPPAETSSDEIFDALDTIHQTHRRGNEDDLELGVIEARLWAPDLRNIDIESQLVVENFPGMPDMMDANGIATIHGNPLQQQTEYFPPDPSISTIDTGVHGNIDEIQSNELSIDDRALIVEEDVNFHNVVSADIDLLWANGTPLKDILLYLYDSENTKNKIFKLEASKYYFSILTSEYSYTDIVSDNMYTLNYFLSKPINWFKCYMPRNLDIEPFSSVENSETEQTILVPDKMVISSSYNLLSKFQAHNKYAITFDGLWATFKDTLYSMGYFMERWYYEISVTTNIKSDSNVYERIDEINKKFLSEATEYEIQSLLSFFNNNSTFDKITEKSNLGRMFEAYEMLTLIFPKVVPGRK